MIPSTSVALPIDREIPKEAVAREKEPVREEDEVQPEDRPEEEKFTSHISRLLGGEVAPESAQAVPLTPNAQKSAPKGTESIAGTAPQSDFSMGPALLDQNQSQLVQPTVVQADTAAAPMQADVKTAPVADTVDAPETTADPIVSSAAAAVLPAQTTNPVGTQQMSMDVDRGPSLAATVNGTGGGNANGGALAGQNKGGTDTGGQPGGGANIAQQSQAPDAANRSGSESQVVRQADMSFQALMSATRDTATPMMTFTPSAGGLDAGTTLNGGASMPVTDPAAGLVTEGAKPTGPSNPFQAANLPQRGATPATEQVAIQVSKAVKDGQGEIRIRMNPEELGRVDVKMEVGEDGRILAVLKAERPETLDILRRDVAGLEKALQEAGLDVGADSFTFDDSADGQAYAGFDGDAAQGDGNGQENANADTEDQAEAASMIPPEIAAAALGEYRAIGVNVTV